MFMDWKNTFKIFPQFDLETQSTLNKIHTIKKYFCRNWLAALIIYENIRDSEYAKDSWKKKTNLGDLYYLTSSPTLKLRYYGTVMLSENK